MVWFWRRYEIHVEIQRYDRGWVDREIETVPSIDIGSCWSGHDSRERNLTLSLHPSIPTSHGNDCYAFLRTLPSSSTTTQENLHLLPYTTTYHTYWRSDLLPFSTRQMITLRSILTTQSHSSVVLWTNGHSSSLLSYEPLKRLLSTYAHRINVRTVDIPALVSTTVLRGSKVLESALNDKKAWVDGDLVRLLVLWNFGGVWVDMDMVMTRDLRPLLEQEWVEEWDCYRKPYQVLNGALMHFRPSSPYLCTMFTLMLHSTPPRPSSTDWGSTLYLRAFRLLLSHNITPFSVLPWCAGDARNCRLDNRLPDIFEDVKLVQSRERELEWKVESVFGIHLHNQWEKKWPKQGWFQRMVVDRLRLEEEEL
ncbi:hypothetical protein BT69DRAFT_1260626 [Atractiella rhizophila]|nr:hypothetical protein BT69DRAFT_1260626 [Atractiella rhizophila]